MYMMGIPKGYFMCLCKGMYVAMYMYGYTHMYTDFFGDMFALQADYWSCAQALCATIR